MAAPAPAVSTKSLLELVDRLAGRRVLVLADLVLDRFLTGTPKRISREAPVLILRYEAETWVPGGGANAIANIRALGGEPLPVGVVGDDAGGAALLAELDSRGIATQGIVVTPGYRTPTKTRILAGFPHGIKQQIVRYDVEDELVPGVAAEAKLREALDAFAGQAGVAVVSDYGYGTARPERVAAVRQALRPDGLVVADSRFRLGEFSGLDGATPNEEETEVLAGGPLPDQPAELARCVERLRCALGSRFLLVTRGSRGMLLARADGQLAVPVHGTDQVADVTGAGDTVIGTFALALAAGADPIEATLLANYAGGVVVMKMGTATLDRGELAAAIVADRRPLEELQWAGW
jgi:rfaE bifunctional protein kinase chain/domain